MSTSNDASGTLVAGTFLTLDGVMQAPGGPGEDTDGGFAHGGWTVPHWDETMGAVMDDQYAEVDALLLGRRTYEIFAAHWPRVDTEGDPVGTKINAMPKYVASRTLDAVEWQNATLLSGDVVDAVAALRADAGRDDVILVQGSQALLQTLLAADLVEEFWLWIFPLVLGEGKRLFADGTIPAALELTRAETSSSGVQLLRFERAGDVEYGSFALDGPLE